MVYLNTQVVFGPFLIFFFFVAAYVMLSPSSACAYILLTWLRPGTLVHLSTLKKRVGTMAVILPSCAGIMAVMPPSVLH